MLSPLPVCFEWMSVTVCAVRATISLHLIVGFVHIVAIVFQCWHLLQKSENYSNVHIANNNTHQHILKLLSNAFVFKKKMFLNNLTCPSIDYFSQWTGTVVWDVWDVRSGVPLSSSASSCPVPCSSPPLSPALLSVQCHPTLRTSWGQTSKHQDVGYQNTKMSYIKTGCHNKISGCYISKQK